METEDKMGGFGTKRRFGFSKALLSTIQPPHQIGCENMAKNYRLPTPTSVACSRFIGVAKARLPIELVLDD